MPLSPFTSFHNNAFDERAYARGSVGLSLHVRSCSLEADRDQPRCACYRTEDLRVPFAGRVGDGENFQAATAVCRARWAACPS